MQVFVTCPDLGFPAVSVTTGTDSVVGDVLTAAAGEWDIDPEEVELSFTGDTLSETKRLADHGVGANSELEMQKKRFRTFGKCWFVDDKKREKLLLWIRDHVTENLYLDTPTFSEDGCLTVDSELLPSGAKRISFRNSNFNNAVISQNFLHQSLITHVDLSDLCGITTIRSNFLSSCSQITAVNLLGLCSVTVIGNNFLGDCSQITAVDLSGLSSVTTIGNDFLSYCSQVTAVDLSGLGSVTTIGEYFLSSCSQITALDLSGLSGVTTIGYDFLEDCSQITALDISGFSCVTEVEDSFLCDCCALESLRLPDNSAIRAVCEKPTFTKCNVVIDS